MSLPSSWDGTSFMTPSTADARLGLNAEWVVGGVDQSQVQVTNFGNFFQLHMPGQAYDEEFYGDEAYTQFSFCTPDDSWKRLVTIEPLTESPYRIAVGPSLRAVEAQPELIAEPGIADYDAFCGSNLYPHDSAGIFTAPDYQVLGVSTLRPLQLPAWPCFLLPSTADLRLYKRYSVYDPDDLPTGGTQGTMFCGVGWYDFPSFTAEVDVLMPGQRCAAEFANNDFSMPSGRYLVPQDNSTIAYVAGAIEAAKAMRDLILLQPKPTPVFSAGAPFIVGTDQYIVGQPQLSV